MKESYDCDCGICSICSGLRRPNESHDDADKRRRGELWDSCPRTYNLKVLRDALDYSSEVLWDMSERSWSNLPDYVKNAISKL